MPSTNVIRILINGESERTKNAYEFVKESLKEFKEDKDLYFIYFGALPLGMESLVNDLLMYTNHTFLVVDHTPEDVMEYSNDIEGNIIYVNSYFVIDDMVVLNHSFFKYHEEIHLFNILENIKSIAISTVPLTIWEDGSTQEYTSTHESVEILRKSILQTYINRIMKNNDVTIIYYINVNSNEVHTVRTDSTTYSEIKQFTYE
jgi:hypothetical protein